MQTGEEEWSTRNCFKPAAALTAAANTVNQEGAAAYAFSPRHQLAQMAVTGCLSQTFYASGQDQLEQLGNLVLEVDTRFTAQTAVYARQRGYMKDMPATLAAALAVWDTALLARCLAA
jgi:60 kDa SS-A/Ro ribonucleoprotein